MQKTLTRHFAEVGSQMIDGHEKLSSSRVVQKYSFIQEIGKCLKVTIPSVGKMGSNSNTSIWPV